MQKNNFPARVSVSNGALEPRLNGCLNSNDPETHLRDRIRAEGVDVTRSRGDFLFRSGEPAPEIYLLVEGVVGVAHRCDSDIRHILGIMVPRSLIVPAVHYDETARYSAECLSDSKFHALSRNAVKRIALTDPTILWAIQEELGKAIDHAHSNLINLLSHHGASRVATLLHQLDEEFKRAQADQPGANHSDRWADIAQVDLAATLGMTPVYLNQILKKMKDKGVIELKSGKVKSVKASILKTISESV